MASAIIELRVDPQTRKKTVVIHYENDGSTLPIEHEDAHRKLVDKLIEGGALKAGEAGEIVIERGMEGINVPLPSDDQPQAQPQANKS